MDKLRSSRHTSTKSVDNTRDPNSESQGDDATDGSKPGVLILTEDLIRRSTVDDELHLDGTHMDRKLRGLDGFAPVHPSPLSKALAKGGGGAKAGRLLPSPHAPSWSLRVLSLPGHMIARMGPVACLRRARARAGRGQAPACARRRARARRTDALRQSAFRR